MTRKEADELLVDCKALADKIDGLLKGIKEETEASIRRTEKLMKLQVEVLGLYEAFVEKAGHIADCVLSELEAERELEYTIEINKKNVN